MATRSPESSRPPTVGDPVGTGTPLPAQYLGQPDPLQAYLQDIYDQTGSIPAPYTDAFQVKNGTVQIHDPSWIDANPWIWPLMGLTAGVGGEALAGTGLFSGGGGAAAGGAAAGTLPSTTLGTGLSVTPDVAASGATTALADPVLASTAIPGLNAAGSALPNVPSSLAASSNPLADIGKYAKSLLSKTGLGAISEGIAGATQQAAQNRIAQNEPYVQRGKLEMEQRNNALKQAYIANQAMNPRNSPFDPNPVKAPTGAYATDVANIAGQDASQLAAPPQYLTSEFPSLKAGTLEKIGQWAGPILSVLSKL